MAAETRVRYAHRVAWELANGEKIPEGMFVLHGPGCPATAVIPRICASGSLAELGRYDARQASPGQRSQLGKGRQDPPASQRGMEVCPPRQEVRRPRRERRHLLACFFFLNEFIVPKHAHADALAIDLLPRTYSGFL